MILGIETSCDETAAAVVSPREHVVSNVVVSQIPIHARYGGVVPELASRNHLLAIRPTIARALDEAGVNLDAIEAVAVTQRPGLAGCLLVGLQAAKSLAWARDLPLVPIDHVMAHLHAPFLTDDDGAGPGALAYPYVALAVSGGHTSLYRVDGPAEVTMLGQTLDDAAGEAFDKIAKMMGLPYPGGVYIDRLAADPEADPEALPLPRPMLHRGLDFSFSGLKTAVRYTLQASPQRDEAPFQRDLAACAQRAIVDVLIKKSLRACRETGLNQLVVAGGVACNSELRERIGRAARRAGVSVVVTPARYCTDNAAMVAGLAAARLRQDAGAGLRGDARLACDIRVTQRPARTHRGAP